MKRSTLYFLGMALAVAAGSIVSVPQLAAQALNFQSVIAFATDKGHLAFFDQNSGKLYVYDGEGKACLFQGQLKELGKPFENIKKTIPASAVERKMVPGTKVMVNDKGEKTIVLDAQQGKN